MKTMNNRIFNIIDCRPDLSDSKLAKHLGCSKSAVSRWRKEGLTPHSRFTSGIADFLGVTERYLLTGEDKNLHNKELSISDTCGILDRIYEELERQDIKPIRLCEHLGISTGLLSTWKKRGTEPRAKYIKPIAEFLGVSETYLLTGEMGKELYSFYENQDSTNMVKEEATTYDAGNKISTMVHKIQLNPGLKELFDMCENSSPEDIKFAAEMLKRMNADKK